MIACSLGGYSHWEHCRAPNMYQTDKRKTKITDYNHSQVTACSLGGYYSKARKGKEITYLLRHTIKELRFILGRETLPLQEVLPRDHMFNVRRKVPFRSRNNRGRSPRRSSRRSSLRACS